jgi:NDP-sugar pyrophosphorylase family protein
LTDHIPKALVKVAGRPLLGHALQFFAENGIQTIGVNTHYLPEQIERYGNESAIKFAQFHEAGEIRGTGGAIHFARSFLEHDDTFVVANADIIARYSFADAIRRFEQSGAHCMLVAFPAIGKGSIVYNARTSEYTGTPGNTIECQDNTVGDFIGTAFYKREFLKYVLPDDFSVVPVWLRAVQAGAKVLVHVAGDGFWRDIGSPQALLEIHCEIIDGTIVLPVPDDMKIDYQGKRCLHESTQGSVNVGEYSWIESPHFSSSVVTSRTLYYADAQVDDEMELRNKIVTGWGVLTVV